MVIPGALLALTPSSAGAQGTDPLGPTVTQLEQFYATAAANTQGLVNITVNEVEYLIDGPFELEAQVGCVLQLLNPNPPLGPCGR
jgi:hypothetical protein